MKPIDRVVASMEKLATAMGSNAFRSGHESDDVSHYLGDDVLDVGDLWVDYWEDVFGPVYASAYFAIHPKLRADLRVRALPGRGSDLFFAEIERLEKKGSSKLPPWVPTTFFNGKTEREVRQQRRDIAKRVTSERPTVPRARTSIIDGELDANGFPGLRIGDGVETAYAIFGKPARLDSFSSMEYPIWPALGLALAVTRPGYVIETITLYWDAGAFREDHERSTGFKRATWNGRGGVGAGSSAKKILAANGKPSFDNSWKEDGKKHRALCFGDLRFQLVDDKATLVAAG